MGLILSDRKPSAGGRPFGEAINGPDGQLDKGNFEWRFYGLSKGWRKGFYEIVSENATIFYDRVCWGRIRFRIRPIPSPSADSSSFLVWS